MKKVEAFKFDEQINIFDLDVVGKESKLERKKTLAKRKEKAKVRLYHTLHISNIIEKHCKGCKFNDFDKYKKECLACPINAELKKHSKVLEDLTSDKIVKESWEGRNGDTLDPFVERLYKYQTLMEMEKDYTTEEILKMRETMTLQQIAEEIDAYYGVVRTFVNKYKLIPNKK